MGVAASAKYDRHAAGLASAGLDLGRQCAASGDWRLRGLDAGRLRWSLAHGRTSQPLRAEYHLDRQPGAGHFGLYRCSRDHMVRAAGKPDLPMSADQAYLGNSARHNPEDLHVAAISSCHMFWYLYFCANAGIIVWAYEVRPAGRLIESQESGGHFESVHLRSMVTVESGDVQEALCLCQDAHDKCIIANSVNFPVLLELAFQHISKA